MARQRTILITGCSEGGLGDALARAFHQHGQRVIATARSPAKIAHFKDLGIQTLTLDVLSAESIAGSVKAVAEMTGGRLDMLINNFGGGYAMPLADADLEASRKVFEVNVWAMLAVSQAFLPLLLKSEVGAVIVNNTSGSSVLSFPMSGIYNASKAAAAMLTDTLRLELLPFNVKVVELKTGAVRSHFYANSQAGSKPSLPVSSIYNVAKADVEEVLAGSNMKSRQVSSDQWAQQVVTNLLKRDPPHRVWKGGDAITAWLAWTFLPYRILERILYRIGRLEIVSKSLKGQS